MVEAAYYQDNETLDFVHTVAREAGEVFQLPDGRAAATSGGIDAGRRGGATCRGVFKLDKPTGIVILAGGLVYWDVSANKVRVSPESGQGDFYAGVAIEDAGSSQTYVLVDLNEKQRNTIDLMEGPWTTEAALGLGVVSLPGNVYQLAFDAVAEIAQAALYSARTVPLSAKPILEGRVAIFDIGNDAALDIDIGLATGSHASDFETVANFAAIHLDGNALDLLVHSDDGTTDVALVDSEIDAVDDTYFDFTIDARDPDNVGIYINGVNAVPSGTTLVLTNATTLRPVVMIEKTSDDTVADVRVSRLVLRTNA